jgi:deoxyribose-phosphate aldolase
LWQAFLKLLNAKDFMTMAQSTPKSQESNNCVIPPHALSALIDHTLLKADGSPEEITRLCEEARKYHFAAVCINPNSIRLAAKALQGSSVKLATVVGFPLGASTTACKVFETRDAILAGANEIDMVLPIGALKAGDVSLIYSEIQQVVKAARPFL